MVKPDWEVTATTVYCDAVDDEVTFIVYADGACKCTGRGKYAKEDKKTKRAARTKNQRCLDADCATLNRYRDSLLKSQ